MKALYVKGYGLHLRVQRVNDENSRGRGLSGVTSGAALGNSHRFTVWPVSRA